MPDIRYPLVKGEYKACSITSTIKAYREGWGGLLEHFLDMVLTRGVRFVYTDVTFSLNVLTEDENATAILDCVQAEKHNVTVNSTK